MSGRIVSERHGAVLRLVIDNPERANALSPESADALVRALPDAHDDSGIRVVELGGAGDRTFCSGFELDRIGPDTSATGLAELMAAVASCPTPVIAVLAGHAVGAGLELACRCDLRVARRGIRLGLPAVRLGVAYRADGVAAVLRTAPGARRLLLSGEQVPVESVTGFADVLADGIDDVAAAARSLSETLAAAAPRALGYTVRLVRAAVAGDLSETALEQFDHDRRGIMAGGDVHEAVTARREGRRPWFAI